MNDLERITAPFRVWAEIETDCLVHNFRMAKSLIPDRGIMPVIKADAYGHGAARVAVALKDEGAAMFAVATPEEAMQLRGCGIKQPILVLGGVPAVSVKEMAENGIAVEVGETARAKDFARELNGASLSVHIKLDSGMNRLGIRIDSAEEALAEIEEIASLPGITVDGLFSHFAAADELAQNDFTNTQAGAFTKICDMWAARSGSKFLRHCANSAAAIAHPQTHMDLARLGLMLYGYNPCDSGGEAGLRPVMSLRSTITQIKTVPPGDTVSYGRTWTAETPRKIAVVSLGYADGLPRCCSGKIDMLVRGKKAPQIGRICMDMCMLDVTDIPDAATGDIVTVFGGGKVTAADVARAAGTIPYEILCAVSKRVPRVYVAGDGQCVLG